MLRCTYPLVDAEYFAAQSVATMSIRSAITKPSGFIPVLMSTAALCVVLLHLFGFGTSPDMHAGRHDEGPEAHIWQILMTGQMPIVLYFGIRWMRSDPRGTLSVLGIQVLAFIAAAAPVFLLKW
jgi:hypothetical protein